MRLNKKKRILELIETINEGIIYSLSCSEENAKSILNDCITALLQIKVQVERELRIEEIIKSVINEIEIAIINIYDNEKFINLYKKTEELLIKIKEKIINEVEEEIEIAFFPYKVSMWDSMESIWKSAKKDKRCSCYVVPIPFYERNDQLNVYKFCYEGNLFSKDIDITYFEDYKIEERNPDIIYIHNPYDDYNKLTMIDNKYFSENLKKYTDCLVYVPYYVEGSWETIESYNMVSFPVIQNSDKIIAQSSENKGILISNGVDAKKILTLGSPKYDAVLTLDKKEFNYCNSWKSQRDNKVFLFSTGLSELLDPKSQLNNIKKLIEEFVDREHCTLIWRPHPLMRRTLYVMRSNLIDEYESIERIVHENSNILIDTNPDVYPAMKKSDALISDYSSVLFLYIATGKPILSICNEEYFDLNRVYLLDYLSVYGTHEGFTVDKFINNVINGEDYRKEERINRLKNSVANLDGSCGEKIHNNIVQEVLNLS